MSLRTSLARLTRRDPDKPTLAERGAALATGLASLKARKPSPEADAGRRAVMGGALAAAVPLPVLAAPAVVPSDLARACDAAVAHLAWINTTGRPSEWPDERLNTELDRVDDVLWRAADEPAVGLDDLAAKARLLIASDGEVLTLSDTPDDRAMVTILREVAALVPGRAVPPVPAPIRPVEREEYRARLLAAYAEDRASRPIGSEARIGTVEYEAAALVQIRCWALAQEILDLPTPATINGLGVMALASALRCEVCLSSGERAHNDPEAMAAVAVTRALLAFTGTLLPSGFSGFGDEPDCSARDRALHLAAGSLPAWAIAEARAAIEPDA